MTIPAEYISTYGSLSMTTTRRPSSDSDSNPMIDLEDLIQNHQAGIWRYLRSLGCTQAEADDLTQDTFLAVLKKPFESFGPAATAGYLRKVAYNRFISVRRRMGRMVLKEEIEVIDQAWNRLASDDQGEAMLDALKTCLGQLTKRARWSLEMRFRDRLSRSEIASALEITEHGAKNLMQRAKKQLKQCIEDKAK
ncbi:MAG: sigma-70 family RNA polymerase sigma factor [Planctomycetales bacterium]|nr:sigma-70 family RNA polymerase sigma factor [Planctomycetales bacterium]